ncbi:Copia protein [Sesamum angolense]|uniref:Copia protein n=1 Tax=Sesamum angolense TaxID=2727404 RepID=A0AAE1W7F8_9LAMI|nr:Copia protein [Sesamum angolense]
MVRSMMYFIELPLSFWGYALEMAAKLLNMAPSKAVSQMPYEIWHGKPASYKYLRVWGSPTYVKRLVGDKLESRSSLHHLSDIQKKLQDTTSMIRLYKRFFSREMQYSWKRVFQWIADEMRCYLKSSARVSQPPDRYGFMGLTNQFDNSPRTYGEAISNIDSDMWLKAMRSEMDSMGSNQVWTLVNPPKGFKHVGCKWVYKSKLGADRVVIAFKASFLAKEYTQRPGVDFEETYSPVAMAKSIRFLLAIAACDVNVTYTESGNNLSEHANEEAGDSSEPISLQNEFESESIRVDEQPSSCLDIYDPRN